MMELEMNSQGINPRYRHHEEHRREEISKTKGDILSIVIRRPGKETHMGTTENNSKQYTSFQYRGKSYEFNVVPFGLNTSTAALVKGLDKALQGVGDHIISFVDDTLITSESTQQHLE